MSELFNRAPALSKHGQGQILEDRSTCRQVNWCWVISKHLKLCLMCTHISRTFWRLSQNSWNIHECLICPHYATAKSGLTLEGCHAQIRHLWHIFIKQVLGGRVLAVMSSKDFKLGVIGIKKIDFSQGHLKIGVRSFGRLPSPKALFQRDMY